MAMAATATMAQTYNPYQSIGREARVLTLSNGKYEEFFDTDTLEVIGSAILNTKTMKVIGFVVPDTLYSEANLEPELVSRWLSPDPLAAKYPELSPYNFVGNNPIIAIDPNGKEIFIVIMGKGGEEHTYALNATDVREEHQAEFELMKTMVVYLQQTKNENSSMIFNKLNQKISEGGDPINIKFSDGESSVDRVEYTTANINPLKTHGWDINHPAFGKNKGFQSPSVNFGAHELGHVWEHYVNDNKDKEGFQQHVNLLNSI